MNLSKIITTYYKMHKLLQACKDGDIQYVKNNISPENVNTADEYKMTLFAFACDSGHTEIVELILQTAGFTGLNDYDCGYDRNAPFIMAALGGYIDIVKLFLKTPGFDLLNMVNYDGNTAFMEACRMGHIEIAKLLLNTPGFSVLNIKTFRRGRTALIWACEYGRQKIVKMLLEAEGFNSLNEKNHREESALDLACEYGYIEIVELLMIQPNIIVPTDVKEDSRWVDKTDKDIKDKEKVKILIGSYNKNPQKTVRELIVKKNLDIYRLIVFYCDGYFVINETTDINTKNKRFFEIIKKLPLELQALLIHRLSGSTKNVITGIMFDENIINFIEKYL